MPHNKVILYAKLLSLSFSYLLIKVKLIRFYGIGNNIEWLIPKQK